jgi:hypothetical protein
MTESFSSLINLGGRLWVIRIDVLDGGAKIDKVLGKITK